MKGLTVVAACVALALAVGGCGNGGGSERAAIDQTLRAARSAVSSDMLGKMDKEQRLGAVRMAVDAYREAKRFSEADLKYYETELEKIYGL